MKPLSLDLRERVFRAYQQREGTVDEIAERFEVSKGFIFKLRRQQEALGHVKPLGHAGGNPPRLDEDREKLLCYWIEQKPDLSLEELAQRMLQEEGVSVGPSTLCRVLKKLGLNRKKKELCGSGAQWSRAGGVYECSR